MKNYKVYLIKNRHTHKVIYVGLTSQTLHKRFNSHVTNKKLDRRLFIIELVQDWLTLAEATTLEKMLITQYNTISNGLNKHLGGYRVISEQQIIKNKTARLGKKNSEYHKKCVSEKKSKAVICLNDGKVYKSARDAAKQLNLQYSKISLVANGKRPHTKGYKFKFLPENSF
jgi:hypothetical protein